MLSRTFTYSKRFALQALKHHRLALKAASTIPLRWNSTGVDVNSKKVDINAATSPLDLNKSNINKQKVFDEKTPSTQINRICDLMKSLLPKDPNDLKIDSIECRQIMDGYPIRTRLPFPFKKATYNEVNDYIQQITTYSYPKHRLEVTTIIDSLLKQDQVSKLLDRKSQHCLTTYFVKHRRLDEVFSGVISGLKFDADFYGILFDFLPQKKPLSRLQSYLEYINSSFQVDSRFLYKLYYLLPENGKEEFLRSLTTLGFNVNDIIPDLKYTKIGSADELQKNIHLDDVAMTPGILQHNVELLLKEGRLNEAWNFIKYERHIKRYEIPSIVGKMFIDHFMETGEPYFVLPFMSKFLRMTEISLRDYAYFKLLNSQLSLPIDEDWIARNSALMKIATANCKNAELKFNLPRKLKHYAKANGNSKLEETNPISKKDDDLLSCLVWSHDPDFILLANTDSFKRGSKVFAGSNNKIINIGDNIMLQLARDGANKTWENIKPLLSHEGTRYIQEVGLAFVRFFLHQKKPEYVLAMASLLKKEFNTDISFDSCTLLLGYYTKINYTYANEVWWFIIRLLYQKTYTYINFWHKLSSRLDKVAVRHKFKIKDFGLPLTEKEKVLAGEIKNNVKWGETIQTDTEKLDSSFIYYTLYLHNALPSTEIAKLLKGNDLRKAWTILKGCPTIDMENIKTFNKYFSSKGQFYNIFALAKYISADPYISTLEALINSDRKLSIDNELVLKILHAKSVDSELWNSEKLSEKLAEASINIKNWELTDDEVQTADDIDKKLNWNNGPVFDISKSTPEYQKLATLLSL